MAVPTPTFKVALIQMRPKPLDLEYNFKAAADYITQAAKDGASLAVLPEYHLTAWVPEHEDFIPSATRAQEYLQRYQELAARLKINIVPGTILQTATAESPGDSTITNGSPSEPVLYNIAPFISYTGEVLGSYTKKNLWHPERPHLTSPDHNLEPPHTVIETPLGTVGLLVCWDLAFPEAFRALVRQGAKIIIAPTFWMLTDCSPEGLAYNKNAESLFLESTLTARAYENTCAVIFVNAGGPMADGYCGLSRVAMPLVGAVKGSFVDSEPGMRVVEVDMEILEVAERNYKIRSDMAREDWHYGYSHEA